jgi:uncharacterized membrane-anchored protein
VHTLNYDVRVLGREGVLSMEAVASIDQLEMIRSEMRPLLDAAEFQRRPIATPSSTRDRPLPSTDSAR